MCKKILLLLNIFALFISSQMFAQNFKEVDFERLLQKHPMLKKFNPTTRRFRDTKSEFKSVASLTAKLKKRKAEVEKLNEEKKDIISRSLSSSLEQTVSWDRIASIDIELKNLEKEKNIISNALSLNGRTEVQTILPILQKILSEILSKQKDNKNSIVFNKLPRFKTSTIQYTKNGLQDFFQLNDKSSLIEYTKYAHDIGSLFGSIDKTIIFSKEDLQK